MSHNYSILVPENRNDKSEFYHVIRSKGKIAKYIEYWDKYTDKKNLFICQESGLSKVRLLKNKKAGDKLDLINRVYFEFNRVDFWQRPVSKWSKCPT